MKQPLQFSLRSIFAVVLMAAVVAWLARISVGLAELALILAGSLLGAIVPRRFIGATLGGVIGAVAVWSILLGISGWHREAATRWDLLNGARLFDHDHMLRHSVILGACVGFTLGLLKETSRFPVRTRRDDDESIPQQNEELGDVI